MSELHSLSITPVPSDEKRSVVTVHRQLQRNQPDHSWRAIAKHL